MKPFLGVANDTGLIEEIKKYGVEFRESEPSGGIVGASGLLVAFSRMRGIDAACLMGMTPGYLMDPKSAQFLLKVLCKIFEIEVNTDSLGEKSRGNGKHPGKAKGKRRATELPRKSNQLKKTCAI